MTKNSNSSGPQFVRYFGPVLDALRQLGGSGAPEEVVDKVAEITGVEDAHLNELLPSGHPRFRNRVHWARFYLAREGLVDASRRGVWSLSEKGLATFLDDSSAKNVFDKWSVIFRAERKKISAAPQKDSDIDEVPANIENQAEVSNVLILLQSLPASGFERFCQRLLREAGFVHVDVTGRSGDGGIDGSGTLEINPLISMRVLFQCKRYKGSVSPAVVRDFRGAMAGRADKGILITTGTFSLEARREATRDGASPIELVDGEKLVHLLEGLELGLRQRTIFEVDHVFFEQFR